ncbi:carboxypeptidase-like regulatory domain-containing protein, partial [Gemmatimonas sp.]|uniref:carboxypeptidase-like regulatory domain-containing protein n=1 Tax=Gemmatimonas sp. TaxID=1962908 RepID=UPI00286A352E
MVRRPPGATLQRSDPIPMTICVRRFSALHVLSAMVALVSLTSAQSAAQSGPEMVRGRVLDDSARGLPGAAVTITRAPDRFVQMGTTDSTGRFSVRFDPGTGDYLVHIAAAGFTSARRRVERGPDRDVVADFRLRPAPVLATVRVTAVRPVRASAAVPQGEPGTGSSERWADGANGQVPPTLAGDLGALAGTIPGVTVTPGGFSVLGASPASNLTTLNGFELPVGSLPRAARTEARVSAATFDATRGGFSGANVDIRLAAGDRSYQRRNGFVTLEAPQLQLVGPVARTLGAQTSTVRGSVGADGELVRRRLLYNVALDVNRNANRPATLLSSSPRGLASAGLDADSAARLQRAAAALGVPVAFAADRPERAQTSYAWLGRLDEVSDSLRTLTLTSFATVTREGALGLSALAGPSTSSQRRESVVGGQFAVTQYVGAGHRVLLQSKIAASRTSAASTPTLSVPTAVIAVQSDGDGKADGVPAGGGGLTTVRVGGAAAPSVDDRRWTVEGAQEMFWNVRGRAHRMRGVVWGRIDDVDQRGLANAFGRYTYSSLAAFAANQPAAFSRTLVQPARDGRTWNTALAVSDEWTKSPALSFIYGLRAEARGYLTAPPANAALGRTLGITTGSAPRQWNLSPRAGFTYTYNTDRNLGTFQAMNMTGRYTRGRFGVVRGGIGEFRDLLRPALVASARGGTGLPGSTFAVSCVGAAVPIPDWGALAASGADDDALPTGCLGESPLLAERAPDVVLLDPRFDVPRAWRASLNWMTAIRRMTVRVD